MALLTPTRRHPTPWPAAGVWPGLFDVPRVPAHAWTARRLAAAAVRKLPMTLLFPDGTRTVVLRRRIIRVARTL